MGTYIVRSNDGNLTYKFVDCKLEMLDNIIYISNNNVTLGIFNLSHFHIFN